MTKQDVHHALWDFRKNHRGVEPRKITLNPFNRSELLHNATPGDFQFLDHGRERYLSIYLEVSPNQPMEQVRVE